MKSILHFKIDSIISNIFVAFTVGQSDSTFLMSTYIEYYSIVLYSLRTSTLHC